MNLTFAEKEALNARLEESKAQMERGEGIPGDQLLQYLADKRQLNARSGFGLDRLSPTDTRPRRKQR